MCVFESGEMIKIRIKIDGWGPIWAAGGKAGRGESKRSTSSSSRERSAVYYLYSTAVELPPIFALGRRLLLNEKVVSLSDQFNAHTVWSLVLARPIMLVVLKNIASGKI